MGVCGLKWSPDNQYLASGGNDNKLFVWSGATTTPMQTYTDHLAAVKAKLTGHSYRVLYLAMSPDGEAIVTGAGDETLRFWNVFSKARSQKESKSALNLFTSIR